MKEKINRKLEILSEIKELQEEFLKLDKKPLMFGNKNDSIFVEEDTETYDFSTFIIGANFTLDSKNINSGQFRTTSVGLLQLQTFLKSMLDAINLK